MNKILSLVAIVATAALAMTSCLSGTPDNKQEISLFYSGEECFNRVVDLETGEVLISVNPTYKMTFEMIHNKLDIEISNIQLANGFSGLSFKLPTMDFQYDAQTGFIVAKGTDIVPSNATGSYVFDSFTLQAMPSRYIDNTNCPVYQVDFTVNGRYHVTAFPTTTVLVGTTRAQDKADFSAFSTKDPYLVIGVDPAKSTGTVVIGNARFSSAMLTTTLKAVDLPVTITDNGYEIATPADTDHQIVTLTGKPIEGCTFSDLKVSYLLSGATGLQGNFSLKDLVSYDESTIDYFVQMEMKYLYDLEGNN